jgi:serine/threonine protein kinase/predicted Zn-dependent protease
MRTAPAAFAADELDSFVEAFEAAQHAQGTVDLRQFLPSPSHPLYLPVLRELVRVDLEYGWEQGRPPSLADYQGRFPELFRDRASLEEIAFEEYRLRRQAGQAPTRAEYEDRYGICTGSWPMSQEGETAPTGETGATGGLPASGCTARPATGGQAASATPQRLSLPLGPDLQEWLEQAAGSAEHARLFSEVHGSDRGTADRLAEALAAMPEPGSSFLSFTLISELGRGAFGRVYLARQGDLANRLVAVKVSADLWTESQTLAQLQHTNIVPIYSLHRAGPLQAVCMPYLGATTVADLLKEFRDRAALPETAIELESTLASRLALRGKGATGSLPASGRAESARKDAVTPLADKPPVAPGAVAPAQRPKSGMTYVDAILALGARLADGLAHAHERGILHRDLKPANILLGDDGQPLLLDFNLSEDTKLRGALAPALIGGTLAYMAPEHLEAFHAGRRCTDPRSDLYSLGVILFELLTGRQPFPAPRGPIAGIVPQLCADRGKGPPPVRPWNRAVSPAVEAIVQHCLEPSPARRYQSARELAEDLKCQLENQPLRHAAEPSLRERLSKWRRRHPRLTSAGAVAAVAGLVLCTLLWALYARNQRLARLEAVESANRFRGDSQMVQFLLLHHRTGDSAGLAQAGERGRTLLDQYHVLGDPAWQETAPVRYLPAGERQRLQEEIGDLLLLWSRVAVLEAAQNAKHADREAQLRFALKLNERAESCFSADSAPPALWRQRAELFRLLGTGADTQELLRRAAESPRTARNLAALAADEIFNGRYREALPLLQQARRLEPANFWIWFDQGLCHELLAQDAEAAACYSTCIALAPAFPPAHYKRGLAQLRLHRDAEASADFDESLRLDPDFTLAYIDRALARRSLKQYAGSIQDLSEALNRGAAPPRIYLMRARVRAEAGDAAGAERDRRDGLRSEPADEAGWIARGFAELPASAERALQDFDNALRANPSSLAAMQNKAYVLAEKLRRTDEAIAVLDLVVTRYPDFAPGWAGRGVLWARLGKRAEALRDADAALERSAEPAVLYQVAGIYALTSRVEHDDRREAFRLLGTALTKGYGRELLERDEDLVPIREAPEFGRLLKMSREGKTR